MGYICDHAIIVSSELDKHLSIAHAKASEIFPWISPISPPAINGKQAFFIPPDGSKEGWAESESGDAARDQFIKWLTDSYDSETPCYADWVEVQYNDGNGVERIVRSSAVAIEESHGA